MLRNKKYLGLFLMLCLPVVAYADHDSKFPAEREITIDIMQTDSSNVLSVRGLLSINYTEPLANGIISDMLYTNMLENPSNASFDIEHNAAISSATITRIYDSDDNDIMEYKNYLLHNVGAMLIVECEKDKKINSIAVSADADRFYVNSTGQDVVFVNLDYDNMYKNNDIFHTAFVSFAPMSVNLPENIIIINEKTEICYEISFDDLIFDIIYSDGPNPTRYDSFEEFKKNASFELHYYGIKFMVAPSPSEQLKNGIAKQDITCYSGKILYLNGDGPLCLTLTTFEKLTLRGYFDR